jgi:hypothetical protein
MLVQVLKESIASDVEAVPWERVVKLIDMSAEQADAKKQDVQRMRKVFIQIKNNPIVAK